MDKKFCKACERELDTSEFGINNQTKDKLAYKCRSCINHSARNAYEANPEPFKLRAMHTQSKKNSQICLLLSSGEQYEYKECGESIKMSICTDTGWSNPMPPNLFRKITYKPPGVGLKRYRKTGTNTHRKIAEYPSNHERHEISIERQIEKDIGFPVTIRTHSDLASPFTSYDIMRDGEWLTQYRLRQTAKTYKLILEVRKDAENE